MSHILHDILWEKRDEVPKNFTVRYSLEQCNQVDYVGCIPFILRVYKMGRILGVFPVPCYSQFILGKKLMKELSERGHEVTVISPFEPENDEVGNNYTTISTKEILNNFKGVDRFKSSTKSIFCNIKRIHNFGIAFCEKTLQSAAVQKLLQSDKKFDLVICEIFFNEALLGFAKHYNAPLILFSSIGPSEMSNSLIGNLDIPAILPNFYSQYSGDMNFFQRVHNSSATLFQRLYQYFIIYPQQEQLLKYFSKEMILQDVLDAKLMLLHSHVTTTGNYPLVDGMVRIGGFHMENKILPKDLQDLLDSARKGAVLVSFGTNLDCTNLPTDTINNLLAIFSNLEQQVLWKFEGRLDNVPENVYVSKWLPQQDILAHPNLKLFVTHGGLRSITETIFYGIPIVGVPIFGDQKMNIARAVKNGYCVKVALQDLNKDDLSKAIQKVLNEKEYKDNVMAASELLRDQPMKPLDLAIYWIEYVLKHPRMDYFKSPISTTGLYWFQVYSLDIFIFFFALMLILYVIFL